jgi:hypothetical protein
MTKLDGDALFAGIRGKIHLDLPPRQCLKLETTRQQTIDSKRVRAHRNN